MPGSVLIVDDEESVGRMLELSLREEGIFATFLSDPEACLELLKEQPFDIVISDLCMPQLDGIELLRRAKQIRPGCEVVLMTGYATVEAAREAIKLGAADFITKPFSIVDELKPLLSRLIQSKTDETGSSTSCGEIKGDELKRSSDASATVVGHGPALLRVVEQARRIANSNAPILLRGESGTGKEVFANFIHAHSARSDRPLIKINCASLTESLLESELFGHKKGSFTGATHDRKGIFETANGATLLLDEIGEISPAFQPKLLRVLQDGEFYRIGDLQTLRHTDVRIIASTNRDLEDAVEHGLFRRDLFYRLSVIPLTIPPLRDHLEDLPDLLAYFSEKLDKGRNLRFSARSMETLMRYPWPGNIREVSSAVEYSLIMCEGEEVELGELPVSIQDFTRKNIDESGAIGTGKGTLEAIEQRCLLQAMMKTGGNKSKAARILGISRRKLSYRLSKYGLDGKIYDLKRSLKEPFNEFERPASA